MGCCFPFKKFGLGRADGTSRPGAFARGTAAPLLFWVFDLLPNSLAPADIAAPAARTDAPASPRAPALRHLPARDANPLLGRFPHIVYPPSDVTLELPSGAALALEAAGGMPPYRWAINGRPLPMPPLGEAAAWQPDGPGFVHLTLTDALDHSVEESVRLR